MPYAKNKGSLINNKGGAFKVSSTPSRMQWAAQVVRHFLSVNIQLSTLDRIDEWSQEAKDYSKTWSDDGNTITPWRFQGFETPNMTPERPWGNNTPEMDILANRLAGTEKYTTYNANYDAYDYDEVAKTYTPSTGANIIETAEEVRYYYWNKFGYDGGLGNNTSNWFYPLFGKGDEFQGSIGRDNGSQFGAAVINSINVEDDTVRYDTEGKFISISGTEEIRPTFNHVGFDRISNYTFQDALNSVNSGTVVQMPYKWQGDKLCIVTDKNLKINNTWSVYAQNNTVGNISNSLKEVVFSKTYYNIEVSNINDSITALPILRGKTQLEFRSYIFTKTWFNFQNTIPIRRADVIIALGDVNEISDTLPISIENIFSKLGKRGSSAMYYAYQNDDIQVIIPSANFENCPNIEEFKTIVTDQLKIVNCPKLKTIYVVRKNFSNSDFLFSSEFLIDIDGNGIAQNINAGICTEFAATNCGLTTYKVDAIIKAFHQAAVNGTTNIFLRLDNRFNLDGSQAQPGDINYDANLINQPPSQSVIDNEIADLENLYNSTVIVV